MRRAQTVRLVPHSRPSLPLGTDELSMLKEHPDESIEDVLRRQLLEKDREVDKLQLQIQALQAQLAQRPPLEAIQELQREHKALDLLLQGTQRENERCMTELEKGKTREKMLERELEKLAGPDWQDSLGIPASSAQLQGRPSIATSRMQTATPPPEPRQKDSPTATVEGTMAHVEQVRLLILGMEQRLQAREDKLVQSIERAEQEGRKYEQLRKQMSASTK